MTIKQVAERAGVSVASVSNVINGNYHKVSAEIRPTLSRAVWRRRRAGSSAW